MIKESYISNIFKTNTAGFILEDGTFLYADEDEDSYHGGFGEDILDKNYPEFSNTHPEDDTCIRLFQEPNKIQYKRLEEIIDTYLDFELYCKIEIWDKGTYKFYKIYSLAEGACADSSWEEQVGNWTGYKLVEIIKNYFRNKNINESIFKYDDSSFRLIKGEIDLENYIKANIDKFDIRIMALNNRTTFTYYLVGNSNDFNHLMLIKKFVELAPKNEVKQFLLDPDEDIDIEVDSDFIYGEGEEVFDVFELLHITKEYKKDLMDNEYLSYVYKLNVLDKEVFAYSRVDCNLPLIRNNLIEDLSEPEELDEKIVKKGSKWQVQSEKGRNMGTYDTKKEAEKRLGQVEYFKHMNESIQKIIAYHASSKKFNAFDISKVNSGTNDGGSFGPGLYFTDNANIAKAFGADKGYLYKVELTFKNPYVCNNDADREKLSDLIHANYDNGYNKNNMDDFFEAGYDSVISNNENWTSDNKNVLASQYVAFKNDQVNILEVTEYGDKKRLGQAEYFKHVNEDFGKGSLTNETIKDYFYECVEEMYKLKFFDGDYILHYELIKLEYGSSTHTLGAYQLPNDTTTEGTLILNKYIFDEPESIIKNTIYHELCHYVVFKWGLQKGIYKNMGWRKWAYTDRGWSDHGSVWQSVAAKVGRAVGQVITTTDNRPYSGLDQAYNYIVKCKHCGNEFKYVKRTDFIDSILRGNGHSDRWHCNCRDGYKSYDFDIVKGKYR